MPRKVLRADCYNLSRITRSSAGNWFKWFVYACENGYAKDIAKQYAVNRAESSRHSHGGFRYDYHYARYVLPIKGKARLWEKPFIQSKHGACNPGLFDRVMRPHFCDWLGMARDTPLGVLVDYASQVKENPALNDKKWTLIWESLQEEWDSKRREI